MCRQCDPFAARYRIILLIIFCTMYHATARCQNAARDSVRSHVDTVEVLSVQPGIQPAGRTFTSEDIRATPGSLGDPMRTLDISAETVTNSDLQAIPIIGGDGADAILTLLDGFPITYPYRFLGILSLFNPLSTRRIDVFASGYPVSYGGFAPTAVQVSSDFDVQKRASVQTDLSFLASNVMVHLPISDSLRWGATIASRASHVGLAANLLSESSGDRIRSLLPNVKDVQVLLHEMPSKNFYAYQEGLVSRDHGALMGIDRQFDYSWNKEFAGAALLTFSDGWSSEHYLSWTHDDIALSTQVPIEYIGSGQFGINAEFTTLRLRNQAQWTISPVLKVTGGWDGLFSRSDVGFQTFSSWLNGRSPLHSSFGDVAGFAEMDWTIADNASATVGVRETYFGFIQRLGFEPRVKLSYAFAGDAGMTLSAGRYLQSPSDAEILHGFLMFLAGPNQTPLMMLMSEYKNFLRLEDHSLVAVDGTSSIIESRSLSVRARCNAYYKETQSLIMPARYPSVFTPLDTMSFEPLQRFQAVKWGAGLSATAGLVEMNLALTASLFSHHNRILDNRTSQRYRAAGDIPSVAKLVLQFTPPGWTVNLLYQYSTGAPTTDQYYLEATNIAGDVIYLPLWKELNSSRVPDYRRLDLTIAKDWRGDNWRIHFLCSFLNLTGARNVSNYSYEFLEGAEEHVRKTPVVNTLPFVPNIEVRYEHSL
ncbi:MAG: hypothetical protein A2X67_05800 [Ignavibacteria bacterium GWA2_55_11]|nr:MAG: hypothetical protein A2X67_05800 [Ignavibacteria bacterium GWA2_55_11]